MVELDPDRLQATLSRAKANQLCKEDCEILLEIIARLRRIDELVQQEGVTIDRLREIALGSEDVSNAAAKDPQADAVPPRKGPRTGSASKARQEDSVRRRRRRRHRRTR
jgi:hypothetical protein